MKAISRFELVCVCVSVCFLFFRLLVEEWVSRTSYGTNGKREGEGGKWGKGRENGEVEMICCHYVLMDSVKGNEGRGEALSKQKRQLVMWWRCLLW